MANQRTTLPEYDAPELIVTDDIIDQYGQFEDIFEKASTKGIISVPPESEADTYNVASQKIRLQTTASRLQLLGYLKKRDIPKNKNRKNISDRQKKKIQEELDTIKSAVKLFQKDAGLVANGHVDEDTWHALDELVSFESELNKEFWFNGEKVNEKRKWALHRAILLRLWSLYLSGGDKPKKRNKPFKLLEVKDLKDFEKIIHIFLIKDPPKKVGFNYETISLLFDQDRLTKAISDRGSPKKSDSDTNSDLDSDSRSFLLNTSVAPDAEELWEGFIINVAKIELWLLGFEVKIDGTNNYKNYHGSELEKGMKQYYRDFGEKSSNEINKLLETVTPDLFDGMARAGELEVDNNKEDLSELILEKVNTKEEIDNAWNYLKDKGIRLWDGLKRIWRWVKKIGKKVISFIKNNIFKGFYRFASKAYKIVKKGISVVVSSITTYIKGNLVAPQVRYKFSKDMDTLTIIDSNITIENSDAALKAISHQAKAFNVSCKILSWIFRILRSALSGLLGWAKFLFALVKSYKELKVLYQDFKALAVG